MEIEKSNDSSYAEFVVVPASGLLLLAALPLPRKMSSPSPRNTSTTPAHCRLTRALPKITTDARMVKNFLVVVKMEHVRGPKLVMVVKMKYYVCVKTGQVCVCMDQQLHSSRFTKEYSHC